MKVKANKTPKSASKAVANIKKDKTGIVKAKQSKKKELNKSTVKSVVKAEAAVAAPLTFAEKKVLSVKRKANPSKKSPETTKPAVVTKPKNKARKDEDSVAKPTKKSLEIAKPLPAADTGKAKKQAKGEPLAKKSNDTAKPVVTPTKKLKKGKKAKEAKKAKKAASKQEVLPPLSKPPKKGTNADPQKNEKKKKGNKPLIPRLPQRSVGQGEVPTEATPETLALVPKELVSRSSFGQVLKELKKRAAKDEKVKLFGDDVRFALQIACVKIPEYPSRNCRMLLPHPILSKEDEVCLIVKDLERGRKYDYENTLYHWQDKLAEAGVTRVAQIIPFQQLKQDYREFELRLKLVHRFDRFLVDARIAGHVFSKLGAHFIRRKKNPTSVVLTNDDKIAENIEKALRKVTYGRSNTGRTMEIKFASGKMTHQQAIDNGMALLESMKTDYPGGWLNVGSIYLTTTTDNKQSLLLYMSVINPNLVPVPKMVGPRQKFVDQQNEKLMKLTGGRLIIVDGAVRKAKKANLDAGVVEDAKPEMVETSEQKKDKKQQESKPGKRKSEEDSHEESDQDTDDDNMLDDEAVEDETMDDDESDGEELLDDDLIQEHNETDDEME
ncbi:ribosomal L1 domain-containing protein CG13096-like [Anopheles bellator]|uniref:ribosomal L1 domain-containing protein CG13096-like n=1 Tax=Anopheles bellator TaxID=139047 RepID=UPI0026486742|nr:ribosomal L1 domain-containing protein CG13096-like [Anopheles bellator]